MDIYRITAQDIKNGMRMPGQTFELVAGLTEEDFIAYGQWYGVVVDGAEFNPFLLNQDGRCQYAGDRAELRSCNIVTKRVVVDEIFELTWENTADRYGYQILAVSRLNT